MKFILSIQMDNAAFCEDTNGREIASILHNLADKIDGYNLTAGDSTVLYDSNGNKVGVALVELDSE